MCEATVVVSSLSPHLAQPFDPVYIMDYFKHNSTSVKWVGSLGSRLSTSAFSGRLYARAWRKEFETELCELL